MAENTFLFTLLSGFVLLAIVVGVLRLRSWRHAVGTGGSGPPVEVAFADVLESPTTWTIGFVVLVLGAVVGSLAMVGAFPVPEAIQPVVVTAMLAGSALVLAGFVFFGVYASVRARGHGSAPATGLGALAVGFLAILVVVIQLFLGL